MQVMKRSPLWALCLLLCAVLLSGCSLSGLRLNPKAEPKPEPTEEIEVYRGESEMDFTSSNYEELRARLPELTDLKIATIREDSLSPEQLWTLMKLRPDVKFLYRFHVNGKNCDLTETELDLRETEHDELASWLAWAVCMPELRSVELGQGEADDGWIPWETLARLCVERPELSVRYSFKLYKEEFTLESTEMNLRHKKIEDQGALVKVITACMPKLQVLDMDFCGVDDEHMAEIRDALPNTEVIWRIWFGETGGGLAGYSVRTNVTKILASNPGIGGELTPENTQSLKYCTKVKYLDLGHNSWLREIDFVRYMPDLEMLVLALDDFYDISPLEACTKLRYAELQTSSLSDLRPLSKLKNLTDLNICYCFALHDISPLYELPQLKRLYIGCLTPVPEEQVEQMRKIAPDCEINTEVEDPTTGDWRYMGHTAWGETILAPAYQELREVMGYDQAPGCYAYSYNDPYYYG